MARETLSSAGGMVSVASVDDGVAGRDTLAVSAPNGPFSASGALGGVTPLGGLAITAQTASFAGGGATNDVGRLAADLRGALSFNAGSSPLTP